MGKVRSGSHDEYKGILYQDLMAVAFFAQQGQLSRLEKIEALQKAAQKQLRNIWYLMKKCVHNSKAELRIWASEVDGKFDLWREAVNARLIKLEKSLAWIARQRQLKIS